MLLGLSGVISFIHAGTWRWCQIHPVWRLRE